MRKLRYYLPAIAIGALLVCVRDARAYDQYSVNRDATNCRACHGDFRAASYVDPNGLDWGANIHDLHRNTMLAGSDVNRCRACHGSSYFPVLLNQSNGATGFDPISCVGCHGRAEDRGVVPAACADPGSAGPCGDGAGLRQHHNAAGVTDCLGCHADSDPGAKTVVGENVLPPYYFQGGIGAADTLHASKPSDPCNVTGNKEDYGDGPQGLDNDGDLSYDTADADCAAPTPTATVTGPMATPTITATPVLTPTPVPTGAPVAKSKCDSGKIQCVAKKQACLLAAYAKAEKKGVDVDAEKVLKCTEKFDGGSKPEKGCIAKLESKEKQEKPTTLCTVRGDLKALEAKVDAFVADVVSEIDTQFPTLQPSDCDAGKKACMWKKASCLLKAEQKAVKKNEPVDDSAVEKCTRKFDGGSKPEKGCIAKLEAKADKNPGKAKKQCSVRHNTDAAIQALETKIDAFVTDVVTEIRNPP
jgi:hypothetical protein